jgi:hypothetical protein
MQGAASRDRTPPLGYITRYIQAVEDANLRRYLALLLREGLRRSYSTEQLTLGFVAEGFEGILPAVLRCWAGRSSVRRPS